MPQIAYEQILSNVKLLPLNDRVRLRQYLETQTDKNESIDVARERVQSCLVRDLSAEYQWIETHRKEYAGQWVALKGAQLISHGPHGVEVMEAARNAGHPDAFFKLILAAEELEYTVF